MTIHHHNGETIAMHPDKNKYRASSTCDRAKEAYGESAEEALENMIKMIEENTQ